MVAVVRQGDAAAQLLHAVQHNVVPVRLRVAAQQIQDFHRRRQSVALLQAQPPAVRQARLAFRKLRRQCQNRRNVRAVVHVQRRAVQLARLHADVVVALLHRCAQRRQVALRRHR